MSDTALSQKRTLSQLSSSSSGVLQLAPSGSRRGLSDMSDNVRHIRADLDGPAGAAEVAAGYGHTQYRWVNK